MSKVTAAYDFDRLDTEQLSKYMALFCEQVVKALNNGLDFESNFNAKTFTVSFATANTDQAVKTGFGRSPLGYIVTKRSASMVVYDGATPNNESTIYLRSSAAGTATVLVF